MQGPVLAQYTIRAKQNYIFKTNRVVEIVGASVQIGNIWDLLFKCAADEQILVQRCADRDFVRTEILSLFQEAEMCLVELFCGGGNLTVMYDSMESCRKANQAFSYAVLHDYPGMVPMCVHTNVTWNYSADYGRLMESADIVKKQMIEEQEYFILPFSATDPGTFQALSCKMQLGKTEKYLSLESFQKSRVGIEERKRDRAVRMLDNMVLAKGEESLLAVVHADGNNMGLKIRDLLGSDTDYDICIRKMRAFTKEVSDIFVDRGLKALEECRKTLIADKSDFYKEKLKDQYNEDMFFFRKIVADGDDLTFICNARFAMEYAKAYLKAINCGKGEFGNYSACAGICIFHSHYPFSRAYMLAEAACSDGAKQKVHKTDLSGDSVGCDECWVDFHFVHSGIDGELIDIRKTQNTLNRMGRPWRVSGTGNTLHDYICLEQIAGILQKNEVSRSTIKSLGAVWEDSRELGKSELVRLYGHHKDLKKALFPFSEDDDKLLRIIYDISEIYDIWLGEGY